MALSNLGVFPGRAGMMHHQYISPGLLDLRDSASASRLSDVFDQLPRNSTFQRSKQINMASRKISANVRALYDLPVGLGFHCSLKHLTFMLKTGSI